MNSIHLVKWLLRMLGNDQGELVRLPASENPQSKFLTDLLRIER